MSNVRRKALGVLCALMGAACCQGQDEIRIYRPESKYRLLRPYQARTVPPIALGNSSRLESLLRAGNLYLRAEDVVALAIENNIDVEIQRYAPLLANEVLRRAQAGGALRNVGLAVAPGAQSVSLQGVQLNPSGLALGTGSGVSSGGGIVTQLGPVIPSLDPTFTAYLNFQHATIPQSNTFLTGTTALIQDSRTYQGQFAQNFDFGLSAQLTYNSQRNKVNSPFFSLNPYTTGFLDLQVTQNLLQGFGRSVNDRNIRVQRNNVKISNLQFKQQVITTVAAALNLYWDLVGFDADVRARTQELSTAQRLLDDNKRQVDLGALAAIEITRAEASVYASQQDLVIAQTNLLQQQTVLKNALSRNGIASASLAEVRVIPLDTISIPERDEFRPAEELVQEALANRVEIEQARINIESNNVNLKAIKNSLRPTLQAFAELTNNGLTGDLTALGNMFGVQYLAGGYGNLLAEIARRNYPSYSAGFSLNISLRNRAAQSDYVTSALELRQNELTLQKNMSQVRVDVQNAVIGLQQARARYEAAVKSRVLEEQSLAADQRKNTLGAATVFQVVQDQRDLASALSSEVQAMANYTHAKISLDQALGTTLEVNHVSIEEAIHGRVARPSTLPAVIPEDPTK